MGMNDRTTIYLIQKMDVVYYEGYLHTLRSIESGSSSIHLRNFISVWQL